MIEMEDSILGRNIRQEECGRERHRQKWSLSA
jgi:hypothetical protein